MSEVNFEKDLGIWSTSSLKSSSHCDKAAASATRVLGIFKRTSMMISKELFITLYKTYMTPSGVLCSILVSIYLARDIDTLESMQRRGATPIV